MGRPRHNIARLPFRLRRLVAQALLDGVEYDAIRQLVKAAGSAQKLHGTTFRAYKQGAEYRLFVKRQWAVHERMDGLLQLAAVLAERGFTGNLNGSGVLEISDRSGRPVLTIEDLEQLPTIAAEDTAAPGGGQKFLPE